MFILKKILSVWLMPLPFCLTLLVLGLWLVWTSKQINLGRFFLTCGVLLLLLFSNRFVSNWLIQRLEWTYPPIPEIAAGEALPDELLECRAVVVLGGGNSDTPYLAAINRLSSASRARLVEGVRLLRLLPDTKLVVTGGGPPNRPSHATVLSEAAISLGVAADRIVKIETPRDTEEEATALNDVLGREPFALVTSAWHLRRAMALMRNQGLHAVPCPSDYLARRTGKLTWSDFMWDSESLGRSTWAVYERLGFIWAQARGKI